MRRPHLQEPTLVESLRNPVEAAIFLNLYMAAAHHGGLLLETPEEIRARAAMINQQVWVTRVMPPGNLTHITEPERRLIARWFKGGAQ